ncbi:MAG: Tex-like N-terminal domain-containing protein [Planctomycetota bacterium]
MGSTTATTPVIDLRLIARRLGLPAAGVQAVLELLDAGNTIPFVARYRRDQTGGLDEEAVRQVQSAIARARQLADRKQTILRTIQGQGKLTPELEAAIHAAESPKQLEDLYLPYKPRRLSLAEVAKQRRLEPLAREILAADPAAADLDRRAADFVDAEASVATPADALLGVGHIIADEFSERAGLRQRLRGILHRAGRLRSQRVEAEGKPLSKDEKHFRDYFDYTERSDRVPAHRLLAINRGERAKLLKVRIEGPAEELQAAAEEMLVPPGHPHAEFLRGCARDALTRLVLPSLEREIRREMTDACEAHAVEVFARNLRNLLLQPPVGGRRVLALDPGFKSGCKAVAIDECGMPLEHDVLHVVGPQDKREAAARRIGELVTAHGCTVIAIGNGAAARETEALVAELVAGDLAPLDVGYVIVNESGASVYSTSAYGREELPGHEAAIRSAISIGRRLQDPLSELVKIEPANIGVGLYQHDVKARHLRDSLESVIQSCVNFVGVDVNTASPALLRHVSGLNQATAKNLHEWRTKNGRFTSRKQFLEVPGFGESAYVQAVGFLKITDGTDPLDATWIHPESYEVATQVLERLGGSPADLARQPGDSLAERIAEIDLDALARELGVGRLLLADILEQLRRPGRDPREDLPRPFFKKGVLKLEDLEVGMELHGAVLNVVDFGAFVDIGMHDSGLVHISQLSSRYVRDPHDVVSVGEIVRVWVLELDKARRRVALTMLSPQERERQQRATEQRKQAAEQRKQGGGRRRPQGGGQEAQAPRPAAASGPAQESRPAPPPRPPQRRGRRDEGPPRERQPRVYETKRKQEFKPLSEAMRQGREPLRTFGDLKQFLSRNQEAGSDEPPAGDPPTGEPPAGDPPPAGPTAADG